MLTAPTDIISAPIPVTVPRDSPKNSDPVCRSTTLLVITFVAPPIAPVSPPVVAPAIVPRVGTTDPITPPATVPISTSFLNVTKSSVKSCKL